MDAKKPIGPAEALDQLLQIIREEAASNPRFERRMLEAAGFQVIYRGDQTLSALDPVLVAMRGFEEFRRTFNSMRTAEIKKVGKDSALFSVGERLPTQPGALTDLLWDRASQRLSNLAPQLRVAAE